MPAVAQPEPAPRTGWPDEPARSPNPHVAPTPPLHVVPLTAQQSRLHATVSSQFLRKLEAAGDALSHARPGATPGEILEAGLDLLLAQAAKRRGHTEKPRSKAGPSKPDHVPAHVRREVWERDGGRCQWPVASGGTCGSTRHLELDHVRPLSRGGTSTTDNLRVLCRAHNDLAARLALGDQTMDRYTLGLLRAPGRAPHARVSSASPP